MNAFEHTSAALRVCVDQMEGGRISGRVVSRRLTRPIRFDDVGSLLLQIEAVLDVQKFPQAFQRTRTFQPRQAPGEEAPAAAQTAPAAPSLAEGMPEAEVEAAHGAVSTFLLFVFTRQNTTWQGVLDWLDGSPRVRYSSVLELLKLVDGHLNP